LTATVAALHISPRHGVDAAYLKLEGPPRGTIVAATAEAAAPDCPQPIHAGMYYLRGDTATHLC